MFILGHQTASVLLVKLSHSLIAPPVHLTIVEPLELVLVALVDPVEGATTGADLGICGPVLTDAIGSIAALLQWHLGAGGAADGALSTPAVQHCGVTGLLCSFAARVLAHVLALLNVDALLLVALSVVLILTVSMAMALS